MSVVFTSFSLYFNLDADNASLMLHCYYLGFFHVYASKPYKERVLWLYTPLVPTLQDDFSLVQGQSGKKLKQNEKTLLRCSLKLLKIFGIRGYVK